MKFSVIIPLYNGVDHIVETVKSVLNQTYPDFEVIVVDDASSDGSFEIVGKIDDPRLKLIHFEKNQGAGPTRVAGIDRAVGDFIALLDQDDLFHPEKLATHAAFYKEHPEIGFTYNNRFDLEYGENTVRDIWRPPEKLTLSDMLMGFPIAPSDMVFRKDWVKVLDFHTMPYHGGEYTLLSELFFAGCKFANVGKALNYRRYHKNRLIGNIAAKCESEFSAQAKVFHDPRCPVDVRNFQNEAYANNFLIFSYFALLQSEYDLMREYLIKAAGYKAEIISGNPSFLVHYMVATITSDFSADHKCLLDNFFSNLPNEYDHLKSQLEWAIARGYLLKGTKRAIWGPFDAARDFFDDAYDSGADLDVSYLRKLTDDFVNYENEFGFAAVNEVQQRFFPYLNKIGGASRVRKLRGLLSINRAIRQFKSGHREDASRYALDAFFNDFSYVLNRGFWSIFLRSVFGNEN